MNINIDFIYPIGSIYMSVNSVSPATLFGGTWTQLKDRFLLGAGSTYTNGATGGEATHQLTVSEMPSHSHGHRWTSGTANIIANNAGSDIGVWQGGYLQVTDIEIYANGGDEAHNNMPPYLVVYMWKRTA